MIRLQKGHAACHWHGHRAYADRYPSWSGRLSRGTLSYQHYQRSHPRWRAQRKWTRHRRSKYEAGTEASPLKDTAKVLFDPKATTATSACGNSAKGTSTGVKRATKNKADHRVDLLSSVNGPNSSSIGCD